MPMSDKTRYLTEEGICLLFKKIGEDWPCRTKYKNNKLIAQNYTHVIMLNCIKVYQVLIKCNSKLTQTNRKLRWIIIYLFI